MDIINTLKMTEKETTLLKNEIGAYNVQNNYKREPMKDALGKDEFLKLLTVQMSHQDPLAPMDNKDMIAQLAQFSSVEQMTQVNKTLEGMSNFYKEQNGYSMLGRNIEFINDVGDRSSGKVQMVMQNDEGTTLAVDVNGNMTTVYPENVIMVYAESIYDNSNNDIDKDETSSLVNDVNDNRN